MDAFLYWEGTPWNNLQHKIDLMMAMKDWNML
jgi:hypothetical protein